MFGKSINSHTPFGMKTVHVSMPFGGKHRMPSSVPIVSQSASNSVINRPSKVEKR